MEQLKEFNRLMDEFCQIVKDNSAQDAVEALLRKMGTLDRAVAAEIICRMLVIESTRARCAEANYYGRFLDIERAVSGESAWIDEE